MSKPTTIRIHESTKREIDFIVRDSRRAFSSVVNELLEESIRIRRFPGITFADGPPVGRRARIAGTGLDVFEIIAAYRALGSDLNRLHESFHWLSDLQLRSALSYFEAYPDEIEQRLEIEASLEPETVWNKYPFMRPSCAST